MDFCQLASLLLNDGDRKNVELRQEYLVAFSILEGFEGRVYFGSDIQMNPEI
jgi:hypothetical protein